MIDYDKVTDIFCTTDEFCKEFKQSTQNFILGKQSRRPPVMGDSEVMCIQMLFHLGGFRCTKHFYLFYVQRHMQSEFPRTVSYNRFVKLSQGVLMQMCLFMKTCCLCTCQVEHSRHRSFTNFLANLTAGLIAYSFLPKKPSIKVEKRPTNNQICLF